MTAVAIIPARGGSTRIPRKNVRSFRGQPIIVYSINTAMASGLFREIFVSTEDEEIADIARAYGAKVIPRHPILALNEVGTQKVMQAAMEHESVQAAGPAQACCIYPTAPLMTVADLVTGWHRLLVPRTVYAMSVGTEPLQDAGQWYWGWASHFLKGEPLLNLNTGIVPIPPERVCDINVEDDWLRAEQLFDAMQAKACA